MSWADNGPVLHVPVPFLVDPECGNLGFFFPFDSYISESKSDPADTAPTHLGLSKPRVHPRPPRPATLDDFDPRWQESGSLLLRRITSAQDQMNRWATSEDSNEKLDKFLGLPDGKCDEPEVQRHLEGLLPLIQLRRRVSNDAIERSTRRNKVMWRLLLAVLVAAMALAVYEQWPAEGSARQISPLGLDRSAKALLVGITLAFIAGAAYVYRKYAQDDDERRRFDHRSVAEALRVQTYWSACGLGESVSAHYMQRQRDELSWIRYAVATMTMPADRWRTSFLALSRGNQVTLLRGTAKAWLRSQMEYAHKTLMKSTGEAHIRHIWGWVFTAAGIVNVSGKFLSEIWASFKHFGHHHYVVVGAPLAVVGAALLAREWVRAAADDGGHGHHGPPADAGLVRWIFGRPIIWGWGLVFGAMIFTVAHALGEVIPWGPSQHGWWIVMTGASILTGALILAWSERNGYTELARQNHALRDVHDCALRRTEALINRYEHSTPETAEDTRILAELHEILKVAGDDALDENAEWLIRSRARPLEPFMAG